MSLHAILTTALAAAPPPPAGPRQGADGMTFMLINVVLLIAIFYFLLIRPQRKERQRHQEMLSKLAKGDRVLTNGGIVGQIVHVTEAELTLKTAENTRIVIDRGYVARKITDS